MQILSSDENHKTKLYYDILDYCSVTAFIGTK